jgi:hypothetical protein
VGVLVASTNALLSNTADSSSLFGVDWQAQASDNVFVLNGQVAAVALFSNTATVQPSLKDESLDSTTLVAAMAEVQGMRFVQGSSGSMQLQASNPT